MTAELATDTRDEAYKDVLEHVGVAQANVYAMLRLCGPLTNSELAEKLGWSINRITPRVLELRNMDLVKDAGTRLCTSTGRVVHQWRTT
jgi:DNA-binding MarR family transcriptional regulator